MASGGFGDGLLVEHDGRVEGIVDVEAAVEEDCRVVGKALLRQFVDVDDATVRAPEREKFGHFLWRFDIYVGGLDGVAVTVVDCRQN